jgi:ADP-heptose:LPS heptosyltransferase/glycosyltransferase involved in cell wall biosynthesis
MIIKLKEKTKVIRDKEVSEVSEIEIKKRPILIYFTETLDDNVFARLRKKTQLDLNTIIVTSDLNRHIRNEKLTYIILDRQHFNKESFVETPEVDFIGYYGGRGKDIVDELKWKDGSRFIYGYDNLKTELETRTFKNEEEEDFDPIMEQSNANLSEELTSDHENKILISRWDAGLGDILMLTAVLKSVKTYYKDCYIVMGVKKEYEDLLKNNPYVDEVITAKEEIRVKEYKKIYDLTRFFEHEHYAMDGHKATHKSRVDLLYEDVFKIPAVDRRPLYYITKEEQVWAKNYLKKHNLGGQKLVGFAIDAGGMSRNWPINYFFECQHILKDRKVISILFGNKIGTQNKYDYAGVFREGMINATGLTLRETAALINEVDLMVSVDTGLLHLSAALEKKTIALFGNIRPLNRILYYDTVEELYPAGELACVPCNDAMYLGKCMKVCTELSQYREPAMCLWRLTTERVYTKIALELGILKAKPVKYRPKLSFAMMTHNEEEWIEKCIEHIYDIADEIIMLDDSTDKTRKIASQYKKIKIVPVKERECPKECNYCGDNNIDLKKIGRPCSAKLRQQSFEECSGDWIFRIDADEIIRREDAQKLRLLVDYADELFPAVKVFWFTTVNFFLDDSHYKTGTQGHCWFPDVHKRLQKNDIRLHKWVQPAHERMIGETLRGATEYLDNQREFNFQHMSNWFYVYHYGYLQPRRDRLVDAKKYERMKVKLHVMDNEGVEEWVWKKPTDIELPKGWGTGTLEYKAGEVG